MSLPSLAYGSDGKIESPVSGYQPGQAVAELTSVATIDLGVADEILNRPFEELNDQSLIQRSNLDQKDWLGYSPPQSQNPDETWMFTGTSNITRNKIISTAAILTSQVIYPAIFAQNDDDEEDQAAAYIMENAIEWNLRRDDYPMIFLNAVISGLVNPVSYFEVDYCRGFAERLEGTSSNFTKKKIIDEVVSGFQYHIHMPDGVLLSNPYVFDIQKQQFIIKRRRIPYTEAKALYGGHPDFEHVRPGTVSLLDKNSGQFYDVDDREEDGLVEHLVFSYRGRDVEFPMVNRIYMGNPNTEYNPLKHRTNKNDPRYNMVKYGTEPIDPMRFAYFKSLANKLSNDKELVDRMRQNAVDASTFATFPSIFTMGAGKLDKSVFVPATTTEIGRDAEFKPATGFSNPEWSYRAAREAERDVSDASIDPQLSGVEGRSKTAREAIILQQNAMNNLGIIGKMIAWGMVKPIGELVVDNIIRYQSIGEAIELAGGALGMRYLTMILNDKIIDGQKKSIVIRFTDRWAGRVISPEELKRMEVELFEEAGEDKELHEVNPAVWARRQYLITIEPDALKPKNDAFERSIRLETYDRAIQNPLIAQDPEKMAEVTRDFLFEPTVKGEGAKYIPKDPKALGLPQPAPRRGVAGRVVENQAVAGSENLQ